MNNETPLPAMCESTEPHGAHEMERVAPALVFGFADDRWGRQ